MEGVRIKAVYVVKTTDDQGQTIPGIFDELQSGYARIGWSWEDKLDLRLINEKIQQGNELDEHEQEARRCLGFLNRPEMEDYLIYPHQPARGQFCVVQVAGEYDYSTEGTCIEGFRSFRPCSPITPSPVDWYDEIVPSQLRQRLGRPGRFSEVYDTRPFFTFLQDLPNVGRLQDGSNQPILKRIHNELRKILPAALYTEFNRADLSRRFCSELFERMGYSSFNVQEGPAEAGSDVVVTVGSPLLPDEVEFQIGVQVFAYTGTVEAEDLRGKLGQLLRGWEDNSLNYGALLTTGRCSDEAKEMLRDHNRNNPRQLVRLIEGEDLADLFLRYFPPASG